MKGRLVAFCGIPGGGKTTIAKLVVGSFDRSILIETDAVRGMLARPSFEPEESRFVYDACFGIAEEALRSGYFVALEGTFLKEDYRQEALSRLGRYSSRVDVVWVDCDLETALRRNSERRAVVPSDRVRSMFEMLEPPRGAIRVDSSRMTAESAAKKVLSALGGKSGSLQGGAGTGI